jgi:TonB family protein
LCLAAAWAFGQDAAPAVRVQREADNPLRLIIEAGKRASRAKPAESPRATKPPVERAAVARTATPKTSPRAAVTATTATTVTAAAANAPAPSTAASSAVALGDTVDELTASAEPAAAASAPPTAPPAAPPVATAEPAREVVPDPNALELLEGDEPEFPDDLKRRMSVDGEVVLDFMVQTDGTVSNVTVRTSNEPVLAPIAFDAVSRWRFKPVESPRPHSVQLVFRVRD